ncbi:MAG: hypothetical protein COA50_01220 [Flavobacteriaceae bacterium]|nr:MAG: hypothetical protein COA50_01220 [Flavobacteriaceae bacterium]
MKKISINIQSEYEFEYGNEVIKHKMIIAERRYSEPKLYIPKENTRGMRVPTAKKGYRWYVYFRYKDPDTGLFSKQPLKFYRNINRFKTVNERIVYGNAMVAAYKELLVGGWNPLDDTANEQIEKTYNTIKEAFVSALENKKNTLKEGTYNSYWNYLNMFLDWCKENELDKKSISELKWKGRT